MFLCPVCDVENRDDAKFCRKCGQSRSALEQHKSATNAVREAVLVSTSDKHEPAARSGPVEKQPGNGADTAATREPLTPADNNDASLKQPEPVLPPLPDMASPECPSCWTLLRMTDKYCCWCGEPQPTRVLPFMKLCLECNTQVPEKANYCFSCGTDVGVTSRHKVRIPFELFREEDSEFFPRFDA